MQRHCSSGGRGDGSLTRRLRVVSALAVVALIAACGGDDSATAPPPPEEEGPQDVTAASIELLVDSVRRMGILGTTFRARARARNAAGELIPTKQVGWSTDTPEVLEVTLDGIVRSLGEGEGRAIARLDGAEAVIRVPVREVARLEWTASLGGQATMGPMIGPDGTVYAAGLGHTDWFWAFEPGGAVRWSTTTSNAATTPAIDADGTLYLGLQSGGSSVLALGSGGQTLWERPLMGGAHPPSLGPDGKLHTLVADTGRVILTALDRSDGEVLWEYAVENQPGSGPAIPPAVGADGTVYFRTRDARLHAVSGDGDPLWAVQLGGGRNYSGPAVGEDGTIYIGSMDDRLNAVSPEGVVLWSLDLEVMTTSTREPALGKDGTIYQPAGQVLYAVSPAGSVLWSWRDHGAGFFQAPVVGGDGTVYFGGNRLNAVDANGELKWSIEAENAFASAPAIGLDGMIYAASMDSILYAIRELDGGNGGFDASPWPVWRGNRQNTGRAGP